jgi:hypothetical protein
MQGYISAEAKKTPQPQVHITVDRFANYELVAQTLADLQRRGLQKNRFRERRFRLTDLPCGNSLSARSAPRLCALL